METLLQMLRENWVMIIICIATVVAIVAYLAIGRMFMNSAIIGHAFGAAIANFAGEIFCGIAGVEPKPMRFDRENLVKKYRPLILTWPRELIRMYK